MKMVALIPARAGSKRIPGKNTKLLAGHPLLAYTLEAVKASGVFTDAYVVTEDATTRAIAIAYGVMAVGRPMPTDDEADIVWVRETLKKFALYDAFAILRPTSPFRTAETIQRAFAQFAVSETHSIRAVQPVKEHPGKMWTWEGPGYPMKPYGIPQFNDTPDHSRPTQTLRRALVQNASLEMAWSYVVQAFGTISGSKIAPFFTHDYEGFDLNTMDDWHEAERLIAQGRVELPALSLARIS